MTAERRPSSGGGWRPGRRRTLGGGGQSRWPKRPGGDSLVSCLSSALTLTSRTRHHLPSCHCSVSACHALPQSDHFSGAAFTDVVLVRPQPCCMTASPADKCPAAPPGVRSSGAPVPPTSEAGPAGGICTIWRPAARIWWWEWVARRASGSACKGLDGSRHGSAGAQGTLGAWRWQPRAVGPARSPGGRSLGSEHAPLAARQALAGCSGLQVQQRPVAMRRRELSHRLLPPPPPPLPLPRQADGHASLLPAGHPVPLEPPRAPHAHPQHEADMPPPPLPPHLASFARLRVRLHSRPLVGSWGCCAGSLQHGWLLHGAPWNVRCQSVSVDGYCINSTLAAHGSSQAAL